MAYLFFSFSVLIMIFLGFYLVKLAYKTEKLKVKIIIRLSQTRQATITKSEISLDFKITEAQAEKLLEKLVDEDKLTRIGEKGKYASYGLK